MTLDAPRVLHASPWREVCRSSAEIRTTLAYSAHFTITTLALAVVLAEGVCEYGIARVVRYKEPGAVIFTRSSTGDEPLLLPCSLIRQTGVAGVVQVRGERLRVHKLFTAVAAPQSLRMVNTQPIEESKCAIKIQP